MDLKFQNWKNRKVVDGGDFKVLLHFDRLIPARPVLHCRNINA